MNTKTSSVQRREIIGARRLVLMGLAAAALASLVNLVVYFFVPTLFNFSLDIPLMGPGSAVQHLPFTMVIIASAVAAAGATALLAALDRFTNRPVTVFRTIAAIFLLLSLAAPLSLPVSLAIRFTLAVMHIITAAIIVYVLTGRKSANALNR